MRYYLAPLEGITGTIFRNAVNEQFGEHIDKFFTPFFVPCHKRTAGRKEEKEIDPKNNQGLYLVPQVLTDSAEDCLRFESKMHPLGYQEININLGCPSGTVTSKGRGAGFLKDPDRLDAFLAAVYQGKAGRISVKTRLGMEDPEEFKRILEIYNKYPMEELIIHPRVQKEAYRGVPHADVFLYALKNSRNPVCYNGDIWTVEDLQRLEEMIRAEGLEWRDPAVMLGRGMVANPALIRELAGGEKLTREELRSFLRTVTDRYAAEFSGDMPVLHKTKEIWNYMIRHFPGCEKQLKAIRKAKHLPEYEDAVRSILGS
ncbi:MAG: tRNA-dihydrouridine synthase family protein [Lachnospiraceae bacterium]|nr:tRNA-dihydrouridine synthase family protein [Lachnospiraceae bacterium]